MCYHTPSVNYLGSIYLAMYIRTWYINNENGTDTYLIRMYITGTQNQTFGKRNLFVLNYLIIELSYIQSSVFILMQ